ncbi:MAG: hypothetical protein JXM70_18430, partial [Pirellulales bacterium]|nr:hypothetical protein [Pirellulales bacterium]
MLDQQTRMLWKAAGTLAVFLMTGLVFAAVPAGPTVDSPTVDETGIYARNASLRETLSATRSNLETWSAEQISARKQVKLGPWMAAVMPSTEAAKAAAEKPIDLGAKGPDGKPLWKPRPDLVDARENHPKFPLTPAVLLTRTIQSSKPLALSVGIGGGDHVDIWLNGKRCLSKPTYRMWHRYGCAGVLETSINDQIITSLQLKAGENRLVIQLTTGYGRPFYFSIAPDPVPGFWRKIRSDFSPAANPLLEKANFNWFEPKGWFTAKDTAYEKELLESLSKSMGEPGKKIAAELDRLQQDKVGRTDPRWLALCVKASALDKLLGDLKSLGGAVNELGSLFPEKYPKAKLSKQLDDFTGRLAALTECAPDRVDKTAESLLAEMLRMKREMLVDLNPFLKDSQLLFVKRYTYNSMHYYDDFQHISRWGGNLCVLSLADGSVREIAKQLEGGVFDRYDLSFDGRRIVFGYRRPKPEGFRIHEIGVDGSGLRQITFVPDDERERMARFGPSTHRQTYGIGGYEFWTDDVHPCYLPDGGICFASTRSEHSVMCASSHYLATTNLFRVESDGSDMRQLS